MEEIFLSEKNVANQTKKLIAYLNLDRDQLTKETVLKCKQIIVNSMNTTNNKYGDRKPEDISLVEYIDKMNKKSLSDCIKIFDARKETKIQSVNHQSSNSSSGSKLNSKSNQSNQSNSQFRESTHKNKSQDKNQFGLQANGNQYMRPDEIMGKMKNPQHPEQTTAPSKEYQSYSDAGGYASFSSVDTASGPFITATGEYGLPIEMQNQNQGAGQYPQASTDGKKNYADDLQKKMDSLRYEGGYGGGPAMGQQNMGQPNMGQGMQMDMIQKLLPGVDMSGVMGQQQGQGQGQGQNQFQQRQNPQMNNPQMNNPMVQFAQLSQMMNQMQQTGQVNPQVMQQIMGQMQMLMSQMQNQQGNQMQGNQMQGNHMQGNHMQGNQMQGNQMQGNHMQSGQMQGGQMQGGQMQNQQASGTEFDYSFNSGSEDVGNDFNAAYSGSGASNSYNGVDSFDGVYQHNSITGPVKNLTEQSGDLNSSLERMKAEREQVNKTLGTVPKPATFDPMQSPSQMNGNQNNQYNPNNGFFF